MRQAIRLVLRCAGAVSSLVLLLAGSASAAHTIPPGSPFTGGTDLFTNFPTCFIEPSGAVGPTGLLHDGSHFFATDYSQCDTTYRFPVTGGSALSPQASARNGLNLGLAVFGGIYYGIADTNSFLAAGLYRFDPSTLAVTGPIATFPAAPRAIAPDPRTGDLYVSTFQAGIFRVQNPLGTPTVTTFVCCGSYDGLTFRSDGSVLYAAEDSNGHVVGFDRSGHPVMDVNVSPRGPDGIAVALPNMFVPDPANPSLKIDVSNNVFVNNNDGTIVRIDVNNGNALSVVALFGTRGDLATVGPDHCLYVTQSNTIEKLTPCFFQPTTPTGCSTAFSGGGGVSLGAAANFAVLVQDSPSCAPTNGIIVGASATKIAGDVGVCDGVNGTIEKATIDGDVTLDDGAGTVTVKPDVRFTAGHSVVTQNIDAACNDKDTAATAASALPCDITLPSINSSQTINASDTQPPGGDGITTVCVGSINLVKQVLTVNGPGPFVFRITDDVVLNGSQLVLGNLLQADQILWYAPKVGGQVNLFKETAAWSGTWLVPDGSFLMDHGVLNGSVLAGCTAKFHSGASLSCP